MSKIYNESQVICSCNQIDSDNILNGIQHHIADLYFCPSCQAHKCLNCCLYNIEGKFCSNCLTHFGSNDTHCTKNCFGCPLCTSNLSISVSNGEIDGHKGKKFKFKCTFCEFHYETDLVTKPRALSSIIRSEKRTQDEFSGLFFRYSEYLRDREKITYSKSKEPILDDDVLKKLNMLDLAHLTKLNENDRIKKRMEENSAVEINKGDDFQLAKEVALVQKLSHLNALNNCRTASSIYNSKINVKFPVVRKLSTKKSYKCSNCNNHLLLPRPDSLKYEVKYNAVDFTPTVNVSKVIEPKILRLGSQFNFLLNFHNPQEITVNIRISTVPQLRISDEISATVTLPVPDFKIDGAAKVKNAIHSIPTSLLTSNTALSRSEIMYRMGKSLSKTQGDNMMDLFEAGINWCSIPVNISLDETSIDIETEAKYRVQIPFYIAITSPLPSSLEGKSSKTKLSYAFWNVIDLSDFSVRK